MEIERLHEKYMDQALIVAKEQYQAACDQNKEMPDYHFTSEIRELLTNLFQRKCGVVAKEGEKLIGYMAFYSPIDGFFGNCKGAFSPLGGSGYPVHNRQKTASKMLAAAMDILVKEEGVTSVALSQYANDREVEEALVLNGFGIRCSDAIMKLEELGTRKTKHPMIIEKEHQFKEHQYKELRKDQKKLVLALRRELIMHLWKTPVYFPTPFGDDMEWTLRDDLRVFAAYDNDTIIGFMSIQDEGETFLSNANDVVNICGAYVKEEYRGSQVADELLYYVCDVCQKEGKKYLGVDCETLNPNARYFWAKHFKNYTYSYHRRIDERVIGYDLYLEKEQGAR
ncbi:MAG: hypothetical protein PWP24_1807 [Clostridiales bacterium]|nr:hypothetical protein [Clostridiales bacterium]